MLSYKSLCVPMCSAVLLSSFAGTPASAVNVTFTGTVLNTCVLTVSTPGLLGTATDGTMLSSEELGGVPAIMAVISTGATPTLNFTAPTLTGPNGWTGSPTVSIKYSALSGLTQAYTSQSSSARLSALLDTLTIHGKAVNAGGFAAGGYTLATTATCQQQ